jgi:hypothetical protein
MPVPNYFARLGISQTTTCDSTIRQTFISAWTALHQRVDLGIAQVQEEGEQLLMAYEMLQCESSRECVLSVLQTGKLTCRLPPEKIMPWADAMAAETERNAKQKEGTWTEKREKEHQAACDKAGYLWKKRSPATEHGMVTWIRYHCAFNAYAVLGIAYDATPTQIQAAFDKHALPDDLDAGEQVKYRLCLQTALEMALSPLAERYRSWLGQGFVDIMHDHIPMRLPATRTNVLRELGLLPQKGKRKASPATSLQQWLATAKNPGER